MSDARCCKNCEFENTAPTRHPCNSCSRNLILSDHWRHKTILCAEHGQPVNLTKEGKFSCPLCETEG